MRIVRDQLTGRRGWLTTGALSAVLVGALTSQLAPTAASADTPAASVTANADSAPTVVAPEAPAVAAEAPAAAPVAAPVAAPAPKVAPKPVKAAPKPARKPATAGDVCSGPGWQQKRGARALASLRHRTPAGVTVAFKPGRSGYLGLTYPQRGHIDMFVRTCGAEPATLLRHVMAHEMGHAYDAKHMTPASRKAYMAARGIPASTPWFGCSYCSDFATPAGDFAETYAQWQRGATTSRSTIATPPGPAALARIAATYFTR